ncbi:MAG: 4Fe-4S dicluster domain-containing protein [Leptospiraceae bacterium]|nr:4Fe-4S dicluster domain-containing protein [Leptospiraceae bacterium]MCK6382496.1 4Fe-4S dicluster domain-containing protein [Leptospiraceae bacterium]NUM42261.1 4Fe-4S dicluster domain-containing protein [Leptospiraceae bacterium]
MPHIVTEYCFQCEATVCAAICPMAAFREGEDMLYISPDDCIDCGNCVSECPTGAIFPDYDLPKKFHSYIEINEAESKKYPVISSVKNKYKKEKTEAKHSA